jgi:hypothetical protein
VSRERGVQAAIDLAGGVGAPNGGGAQLELDGTRGAGDTAAALEPRGPGRPTGARGKRTKEWQRWFQATGKLPLEFLSEVYRQDTAQLAADMGCDAKDALRMQISAAEACLPYVEQKMPIAVEDVSEGQRPVIVVGTLSAAQAGAMTGRFGAGLRLANGTGKPQQNQAIVDLIPEQSDNIKSDSTPDAP